MAIAAHEIKLKGFDHSFELLEFDMKMCPNEHGYVNLLIRCKDRPDLSKELRYDATLSVDYSTHDGDDTLFCGVVRYAKCKRVNLYYEVLITLKTGSVLLDRDTKQVAFQDASMTYSQVVNCTLQDTKQAGVIFSKSADSIVDGMQIQYQETDWVFMKRLASHLGEALIPDWETGRPSVYFGTALNHRWVDIKLTDYAVFVDNRFYEEGGFQAGLRKGDFLYYRIHTDVDYAVGTRANIGGFTHRILRKYGKLEGDQVRFTYDWGRAYLVHRQSNQRLIGAMLGGTVLEARDERVRVALDIDAVDSSLFHVWTPVTGNHFYCMPEVDTRVMLYFGSCLESSAKAVENLRENGNHMENFNHRFFASQAGKELSLLPNRMGLGARQEQPKIAIEDGSGVAIVDMAIHLQARGSVAIQGGTIRVSAPSQVSMIRSGNGPTSTFNVSKDFNVCGTVGSMEGTQRAAISVSRRNTAEGLVNPELMEDIAIASIPLARLDHNPRIKRVSFSRLKDGIIAPTLLRPLSPKLNQGLETVGISALPGNIRNNIQNTKGYK